MSAALEKQLADAFQKANVAIAEICDTMRGIAHTYQDHANREIEVALEEAAKADVRASEYIKRAKLSQAEEIQRLRAEVKRLSRLVPRDGEVREVDVSLKDKPGVREKH